MGFMAPAMVGAAGVLGAGALNFFGATQANNMSKKMIREQMQFQRGMAGEQMQFQERMSNTAYQRAVQDMKAAGLNPILAFNSGAASSPQGASASGASAEMKNAMSGAVSSAIDAKRMFAELDNLKEQNNNLKAQNEQIRSQTELNEQLAKTQVKERLLKEYAVHAAELSMPGKQTEAKIDESWFGKMLRWFQRFGEAVPIAPKIGLHKLIK